MFKVPKRQSRAVFPILILPDEENTIGAGAFYQTATKLTQRSPRRCLPNVIELPVQSSHGVSFSIDYFTLTKTIEFSFCLYTLSLHHLGQ